MGGGGGGLCISVSSEAELGRQVLLLSLCSLRQCQRSRGSFSEAAARSALNFSLQGGWPHQLYLRKSQAKSRNICDTRLQTGTADTRSYMISQRTQVRGPRMGLWIHRRWICAFWAPPDVCPKSNPSKYGFPKASSDPMNGIALLVSPRGGFEVSSQSASPSPRKCLTTRKTID